MTTPEPVDPMWATFRRAHPEVTLVLLPGDPPSDATSRSAEPVTVEEARTDLATMCRRVDLIASTLGHAGTTHAGWQEIDAASVRPHVQWRTASGEARAEAAFIAARLEGLGWNAAVRSAANPLLVDATMGGTLARVIGAAQGLSIRASGKASLVGTEAVRELRGETGERPHA